MAVDTVEKRLSMLSFGSPTLDTLPKVDGSIDADDRLHLLGLYSGIAAAVVVPGGPWRLVVGRARKSSLAAGQVKRSGLAAGQVTKSCLVAGRIF